MRRATSSAVQLRSRSRATASSAPQEGAVRIGSPMPDVTLVEMGVHVDKGGEDEPGVEIDGRCIGPLAPDPGDPPVLDEDRRRSEPLRIRRQRRPGERGRRGPWHW